MKLEKLKRKESLNIITNLPLSLLIFFSFLTSLDDLKTHTHTHRVKNYLKFVSMSKLQFLKYHKSTMKNDVCFQNV